MNKITAPIATFFLALTLSLSACASPTPTPLPATATTAPPAAQATATSAPLVTAAAAATATMAAPTPTNAPSPTENPVHAMGQVVKINGLAIALIGVAYTPDQLQVTFAAKNTSAALVAVSFIEFSAVPPDGTKLQTDACFIASSKISKDYAVPGFSGSLAPGENLRGTICWKGPALGGGVNGAGPTPGIQVVYTPESAGKPVATWDVTSAGKIDVPADLATSDFASPPHAQAEAVALKDITISFDGLTYVGVAQNNYRVVMAHFTVENKGSASYHFGEFLSYSFSVKLADGSPLFTDFMTAGCQNTNSKVEITPHQKRSLTLCFVSSATAPLAPGTLASFIPNLDQGDKVIWVTK